MTATQQNAPRIASARPELTRALMAQTGLDDALLTRLVHAFYARVRADAMLGPIFAARIADWDPHLARMVDFWSSVALMTGRYHGAPVVAHTGLPVTRAHFDRWLALFRETASALCSAQGTRHLTDRAERIARALSMAVEDAQRLCPHAAVMRPTERTPT
jgi:hemoglobin